MVVRSQAAPPTPWSKTLAEPQIHDSAYVHSFSNLIGDVRVGANVMVAPGTSIRADGGLPFYIGDGSNIQDGVVINGLEQGRVRGDDGKDYSTWIGKNTCIAHLSLIHGPAYVGDDCFIGFRSTVFNARVGKGCIVMMHALIQDVEIAPGKFVPSGAVITSQAQADRLPDVSETDSEFAHHVVEINEALRAGYRCAEDDACIASFHNGSEGSNGSDGASAEDRRDVTQTMSANGNGNGNIGDRVRSLVQQGCRIGAEYADKRRFKTKSWRTIPSFEGRNANEIIAQLERCLQDHSGEYVRIVAVDPEAKRRVDETIVQRPGEGSPSFGSSQGGVAYSSSNNGSSRSYTSSSSPPANGEASDWVRSTLNQGLQIGIEHADKRRFRTKSWLSGGIIDSHSSQAIGELEATLRQYEGEYVRLIAIDPHLKRRVSETIVQRPGETAVSVSASGGSNYTPYTSGSRQARTAGAVGVDGDMAQQVRSLLQQGYRVGTEHADKRRFRTKSWKSCAPINSSRESEVLEALQACLQEHQGEYVRLLGIDVAAKRRVLETIIQRPDGAPANGNGNGSTYSAPAARYTPSSATTPTSGSNRLDSEIVQQVRSLLQQGYRIGSEHADKRRFRTKSWQSCTPVESTRETDVLAALEACLQDHQGEYVRLIGIDTQAKRRVLETIIQRP